MSSSILEKYFSNIINTVVSILGYAIRGYLVYAQFMPSSWHIHLQDNINSTSSNLNKYFISYMFQYNDIQINQQYA